MVDSLNAGQLKQLHTTFQILDGAAPPRSGTRVKGGQVIWGPARNACVAERHSPFFPPHAIVLYVRLVLGIAIRASAIPQAEENLGFLAGGLRT